MASSSITQRKLKFDFSKFFKCAVLVLSVVLPCNGYQVNDSGSVRDPYQHREVLDPQGKYLLEWRPDFGQRRVYFNVTVQTLGYVGFGLSRNGKMSGADIVIGGVEKDGKSYFSDRYAIRHQLPSIDLHQDWTLHSAWESATHTFLSFSRAFDTCDDAHDMEIHDDVLGLLWAYGEKDNEIEYHHQNRGVFYAYLLDPEIIPDVVRQRPIERNRADLGDMKIWTLSGAFQIPPRDTTYICTMHRAPQTGQKQHIVGFNSILETEVERRHIHHFLLHRCRPPVGGDSYSLFHRHVGTRGEECYVLRENRYRIPTQYCTEVVHVWAVGQRANFFPPHVGLPLSEEPNEYYMLQMHYDNPELLPGIQVRYSLEVYYTENLRKHDGGMMTLGGLTPSSPALLLPPSSLAHRIYGHCGSGCTELMFPREGVHVFATNLHTHLAGRGVRLMHLRDNQELPLISYDDNYNFNFQQIRLLREERTILPGDSLINRCVYENTNRNGSVTVGGFSTRHEMCTGFIWYYNKLPNRAVCRSDIRSDLYRSILDIWNVTWSDQLIEMVVTSPTHHAGIPVSEVTTNRTDWTIQKRKLLQKYHRYLPQISQCPPTVAMEVVTAPPPFMQGYLPEKRVPPSVYEDIGSRLVQNEIINPDYEFISIYPANITPYERPRSCWKK